MDDTGQLMRLKATLQEKIRVLETELNTVDKAIQLLERESQPAVTGSSQDKRFRKVGLSDACRQIVGAHWISPTDVRNQMIQGGYPQADKGKLLGSVFATLKRLGNTGELEAGKIDGKVQYRRPQSAAVNSTEAAQNDL